MLGIIAAVLIVLWLLGFFAFHVTTGFIHTSSCSCYISCEAAHRAHEPSDLPLSFQNVAAQGIRHGSRPPL